MKDPVASLQTTFCVHLIAIAGSQRRPRVRMLFVATAGADAVYEAQGSWSECLRRIRQAPFIGITKQDLAVARKEFGRSRYTIFPLVKASFFDIESMGLQRVDK
jgi:hypothetical protein